MNHTQASCGHNVVAVGAPGSAARMEVEGKPCERCGGKYVEQFRYNWGSKCDGTSYEQALEAEVQRLRDGIEFWSYCMDQGMKATCPESVEELSDFLMSCNIAPYSMRNR